MADNYELLRSKDIISILDGDVTIEEKENCYVNLHMMCSVPI